MQDVAFLRAIFSTTLCTAIRVGQNLCNILLSALCWMSVATVANYRKKHVVIAMCKSLHALRLSKDFNLHPVIDLVASKELHLPTTLREASQYIKKWIESSQHLFRVGELIATWHSAHDGPCS